MDLNPVRESLNLISRKLEKRNDKRDKILRDSRGIISEASKAIVSIHSRAVKDAQIHLKAAMEALRETKRDCPRELERYIIPPESEIVEASILLWLESQQKIPSIKDLKVNEVSYLFGLLDAIGELKREAYDAIRLGKSTKAYEIFRAMEAIYLELVPTAIYDGVAPGLRRKLDSARALVESTRGAVIEEIRRSTLIRTMAKLGSEGKTIYGRNKKAD